MSKMKVLYEEMCQRMKHLESLAQTNDINDSIEVETFTGRAQRMMELQLAMVRVQQMIMDELNAKIRSEEAYNKYVNERIRLGKDPMTRTQSEFAKFLFHENISTEIVKTGNLNGMFDSVIMSEVFREVRGYLKGS